MAHCGATLIAAFAPSWHVLFWWRVMGVASAFGRIGGLSAPIVIGYAYPRIGFGGVFLITTIVLVLGALAVALLGIATAGKSLEQIAAEAQ